MANGDAVPLRQRVSDLTDRQAINQIADAVDRLSARTIRQEQRLNRSDDNVEEDIEIIRASIAQLKESIGEQGKQNLNRVIGVMAVLITTAVLTLIDITVRTAGGG